MTENKFRHPLDPPKNKPKFDCPTCGAPQPSAESVCPACMVRGWCVPLPKKQPPSKKPKR